MSHPSFHHYHHHTYSRSLLAASSASSSADGEELDDSSSDIDEPTSSTPPSTDDVELVPMELSRRARLRKRLFPPKTDEDGLTFRQKLAKAGLSVVLSYGWVSNVSYAISVSIAWYIFSSQTGLSPLAPGQWKKFLGVYAGFWVFNNMVRPIRFALSVGVSLYFERLVENIQTTFRVRKGVAIFLTVFLANVVGTIALSGAGIWLASLAAGVPVFVK
eukprot:scaffold22583_cov106-Cylindrotheca_fusiformis.AAC.12